MIYGLKKNLNDYIGLNRNLDKAIEYINNHRIDLLPNGKTEIFGEDVYVNVVESELLDSLDGLFEFHKKYLDLHIDIDGMEKILFSERNKLSVSHDYENDGDYALGDGDTVAECTIDQDHFCICMLDEPHKPCVKNAVTGKVKKAIFKIKVDM